MEEGHGCVPIHFTITYLFILKSPLANNDIFYSCSGAKLLLMDGVILVNFLTFIFWEMVQGILIHHSGSLMLVRL